MLKDAIELCLKYGWVGPELASNHANSRRVRPNGFNGWLDEAEARAKRRLFWDISTLPATSEALNC